MTTRHSIILFIITCYCQPNKDINFRLNVTDSMLPIFVRDTTVFLFVICYLLFRKGSQINVELFYTVFHFIQRLLYILCQHHNDIHIIFTLNSKKNRIYLRSKILGIY